MVEWHFLSRMTFMIEIILFVFTTITLNTFDKVSLGHGKSSLRRDLSGLFMG